MPMGMGMRAVIYAPDAASRRRAGRTARSLAAAGLEPEILSALSGLRGAMVLAEAGTWLRNAGTLNLPRAMGLLALASDGSAAWQQLLRFCGGDLAALRGSPHWPGLPFTPLCYVEDAALLTGLAEDGLQSSLHRAACDPGLRTVRLPQLDAAHDAALRVLQVVTTIQTGGAERVVLDLAEEMNAAGCPAAVAVLGRPGRASLPEPRWFFDLSGAGGSAEARADAVRRAADDWGADLVHAHLLRGDDVAAIRRRGLPVLLAVHNAPEGWQPGLLECGADLYLACAVTVERSLRESGASAPVRTVWNGIVPSVFAPDPQRRARGAALRQGLGVPAEARVVLVLANFRPQKRLDLLPAVLSSLAGNVHLVIAGEASPGSESLAQQLAEEFRAHGDEPSVHWAGTVSDVPALLAASDVLFSPSAWEGLSLAHLEALAAGIPVVATDAGGTREIAARHAGMHLLPLDAAPEQMALAVSHALMMSRGESGLPHCFTRHVMARRVMSFCRRVLSRASQPGQRSVWLIANNFSTGGAQTSARRLLAALADDPDISVRAVTVQEDPDHPTPGRLALEACGIPVTALPPADVLDPAEACARLLDLMDDAPETAVLFWNVIPAYKLCLADQLLAARVHDVSPGEMYYTSLARYFDRPRPDLPLTCPAEYGARLAAFAVKYERERTLAEQLLKTPVCVIPNGVPQRPDRVMVDRSPLILATAARLSPDKRIDLLLAAVRLAAPRLPAFELHIAGGPERDFPGHAAELRMLAEGLPVVWRGDLPDTSVLLDETDIFLMISEPAGCPNASLEALAAGVPVIATDWGGASEQVIDRVTGRLVPHQDVSAFAEALVELADDFPARARMSAAAQNFVRDRFSMQSMTEALRSLLVGCVDPLG